MVTLCRLFCTVICAISFFIVSSQTLSVVEFKFDETDNTANTHGTIVYDQNGDKCALIKIETNEVGFTFDVGLLGVVKTEQRVGEMWLYVPAGVKRISISHPQIEKLRDYDLGMSVKKAKTYILKLKVTNYDSKIDVKGLGTLDVKTDPEGAEVFVDDVSIGRTPLSFSKIFPGKHRLLIRKGGYFDYETTFELKEDEVVSINESLGKSCDIEKLHDRINFTIKGVHFTMKKVEGGTFKMGATKEQKKPQVYEIPVRNVTLSDYFIGETEVTQALWAAIMGSVPSKFGSKDFPVRSVSWEDCQRFVYKLRQLTGLNFRLPTEAEWEYAARGGKMSKKYIYSGGNNPKTLAWYKKTSEDMIHLVKIKLPNELGLYDMSVNVWEWCQDWHGKYPTYDETDPQGAETGETKVLRGGSTGNDDYYLRVSCRGENDPLLKNGVVGLRLALTE